VALTWSQSKRLKKKDYKKDSDNFECTGIYRVIDRAGPEEWMNEKSRPGIQMFDTHLLVVSQN
jgi:hypothetical protein